MKQYIQCVVFLSCCISIWSFSKMCVFFLGKNCSFFVSGDYKCIDYCAQNCDGEEKVNLQVAVGGGIFLCWGCFGVQNHCGVQSRGHISLLEYNMGH